MGCSSPLQYSCLENPMDRGTPTQGHRTHDQLQNWDLKPGRLTPRPALTTVFCSLISHNYQYFIGKSITQHPGLRSANRGTGIIMRGRILPGSSPLRPLCPGRFAGLVSALVLLELRASQPAHDNWRALERHASSLVPAANFRLHRVSGGCQGCGLLLG